ncbi:MAG: ATP-binding cassette domain-containing protein [Thermoproteus sp. AZ2]|uniref:ATP-binding cassette domain-containing protein n=1 Tax=Thermoproteus sp. AZ2 TaxID=1609232 RepID=A0ACC6V3T2_9CREN
MMEEAKKALKELQVELDVNARIENLSGGQRQAVAIARALFRGAKLLLLDEPIANLSATEAAAVIDLIHKAKEKAGVLVIIHDIPQAYEVADRIYLIDRGKILLETEKRKTTPEDIERFIVEMSEKAEKAVE